jgi:hypothetical protein
MSNTKSNYQKLRDKDVSLMVQKKVTKAICRGLQHGHY